MSALCPYCGDSPDLPVTARWEFVLPLEWPSPQARGAGGNRVSNAGAGRFLYKRLRDEFARAIMVAARCQHNIPAANGFRRVTLTRLWGHRKRVWDDDNLVAGGKLVRDALVWNHLLLDDCAKFAKVHYKQERNPTGGKRPCDAIRVVIEEIERMQ